uniref:Histone-lysine N-methyltransferase SETMAR n=1 Tax=Lygus hesperus TaxID=30085 RepID=A0A0K8S533_LYGHE
MLTVVVCLLHDNAQPHVARGTTKLLEQFGWDVSTHPPYSPDLAPSDYHFLLTETKEELAGICFSADEGGPGSSQQLDTRGGGKFLQGGDFKARCKVFKM